LQVQVFEVEIQMTFHEVGDSIELGNQLFFQENPRERLKALLIHLGEDEMQQAWEQEDLGEEMLSIMASLSPQEEELHRRKLQQLELDVVEIGFQEEGMVVLEILALMVGFEQVHPKRVSSEESYKTLEFSVIALKRLAILSDV